MQFLIALSALAVAVSAVALPAPAAATPTPSACVINIFDHPTFASDPTCTAYQSVDMAIAYTECGGCSLQTLGFGFGPVNPCSAWVTSAVTTVTQTKCSPTPTP